jgi:hypothetical protein
MSDPTFTSEARLSGEARQALPGEGVLSPDDCHTGEGHHRDHTGSDMRHLMTTRERGGSPGFAW